MTRESREISRINITEKFIRHSSLCTGHPLLAACIFAFLYEKRERGSMRRDAACAFVRKNPPSRIFCLSSPPPSPPPLSFSPLCVFYCKLRLKSLAQSQAFHLGRCIPADTHERYVLAYVSRARTRASRSRICEEKSSYVLPAGSEVRFTYTYMIRAWIEKVSRIRSIFFSWSECRDATCLRISSDWK